MDRAQYVTNQKGGKHLKDMNGMMEEEAIKSVAQSLEILAQILLKSTNGNILFLNASRNKAKIRIIPFIPVMLVILVKEFVYLSIFLSIYLSIAVFQFIVLFIYHY